MNLGISLQAYSHTRTEIEGVSELKAIPIDLADSLAVNQCVNGVDAIVSTIGGAVSNRVPSIAALIQAANLCSVNRIICVGGAGVLPLSNGTLLKDKSGYPSFLMSVSNAHFEA